MLKNGIVGEEEPFLARWDDDSSTVEAIRMKPYTLQKRNIEMRRGRDAYAFLVPKRSKF